MELLPSVKIAVNSVKDYLRSDKLIWLISDLFQGFLTYLGFNCQFLSLGSVIQKWKLILLCLEFFDNFLSLSNKR